MTAETSYSVDDDNDDDNHDDVASFGNDDASSSSISGSSLEADSTRLDSSSRNGGGVDSSSSEANGRGIAKSETAAVFRLRVIVIVVLLMVASVVSAVVLQITRAGEHDEFETQFAGASHVLQARFEAVIDRLSVISALAVVDDAAAQRRGLEEEWPFRTVYNFKERASNARQASGALSIAVCPLVTIDKRELWEDYVNGPVDSQWMYVFIVLFDV